MTLNPSQIKLEARKLLKQYRDVLSLDKSRTMLINKYGEITFSSIRQQFASLWLEDHGVKTAAHHPAQTNNAKKKGKHHKDAAAKEAGRKHRYDKAAAARAARIISPPKGPKAHQIDAERIQHESIYTHSSIHTLRG